MVHLKESYKCPKWSYPNYNPTYNQLAKSPAPSSTGVYIYSRVLRYWGLIGKGFRRVPVKAGYYKGYYKGSSTIVVVGISGSYIRVAGTGGPPHVQLKASTFVAPTSFLYPEQDPKP